MVIGLVVSFWHSLVNALDLCETDRRNTSLCWWLDLLLPQIVLGSDVLLDVFNLEVGQLIDLRFLPWRTKNHHSWLTIGLNLLGLQYFFFIFLVIVGVTVFSFVLSVLRMFGICKFSQFCLPLLNITVVLARR